jgi:ADP-ribose pyrophosphatase
MRHDKPNAARLGWRLLHTYHAFANRFMRVRHDTLIWPNGEPGAYSYVTIDPIIIVVPVTAEAEVVLIRQFRYTIDDWAWEVPAGGSHDFEGDDLTTLVARELREEIGGKAGAITWIGHFHPLIGKVNTIIHLYLATGVTLSTAEPEPGELIEIHCVSIERALGMARDGTMTSATSAYALLRCAPYLHDLDRLR